MNKESSWQFNTLTADGGTTGLCFIVYLRISQRYSMMHFVSHLVLEFYKCVKAYVLLKTSMFCLHYTDKKMLISQYWKAKLPIMKLLLKSVTVGSIQTLKYSLQQTLVSWRFFLIASDFYSHDLISSCFHIMNNIIK